MFPMMIQPFRSSLCWQLYVLTFLGQDPLSGWLHANSPFLFLDVNSRVIKNECSEENMAFSLKAKGDKMTISCSTIKESGSTGTDPLRRIRVGSYGTLSQQTLIDHLLGAKTYARWWGNQWWERQKWPQESFPPARKGRHWKNNLAVPEYWKLTYLIQQPLATFVIQHLKCGQVVNLKYLPDFKDLVQKKKMEDVK